MLNRKSYAVGEIRAAALSAALASETHIMPMLLEKVVVTDALCREDVPFRRVVPPTLEVSAGAVEGALCEYEELLPDGRRFASRLAALLDDPALDADMMTPAKCRHGGIGDLREAIAGLRA